MLRRALALLLVVGPASAGAYELKHDSTGAEARWAGSADFVVSPSFDADLDARGATAAVGAAIDTLGRATGALSVTVRTGTTQGVGYDFAPGASNQSEIVTIDSDWPYDAWALAVTVVTVDVKTHRILDADITLNTGAFRFAVIGRHEDDDGKEGGRRQDDVQNTVTHELGHALGLAHNTADTEVVMYPKALPGETGKRVLALDDEAGLAFLYPPTPERDEAQGDVPPRVGCSTAGGLPWGWIALCLVPVISRRRTALAAAAGVAVALAWPGTSVAASRARRPAPAREAAVVATAEVLSARTQAPSPGARLLVTEVRASVRRCLKGPCPATMVVLVPGGRWGSVEQWVDGAPPPAAGDAVGLTLAVESGTPAARGAELYRLAEARDFAAFASGLSAAALAFPALAAGSSPPRPVAGNPPGPAVTAPNRAVPAGPTLEVSTPGSATPRRSR